MKPMIVACISLEQALFLCSEEPTSVLIGKGNEYSVAIY